MKTLLLTLSLSSAAFAADFKESDCPLTRAQVATAGGGEVKSVQVVPAVWNQIQCVYKLETCSVYVTRLSPEGRSVKTEAELAAKLAVDEKRRLIKDFPVPAYSRGGGLYVVLPNETWDISVMRGADKNADPQLVARALVNARKK